jgi:hypothetical protein
MTQWTVETQSNGSYTAAFAINDPAELNNFSVGESATFELTFQSDGNLTVASGETVSVPGGETRYYGTITIENNGTLDIDGTVYAETVDNDGTIDNDGTLTIQGDSVSNLLTFDEFAGDYATVTSLTNRVSYREQYRSSEPIDSLVFGLTSDLDEMRGVWGLVDNVTDTRPNALNVQRVSIEVTVLATYNEYSDHSTLETDLEL